MENRLPSGLSNPYLVQAATIAAGLDGVAKGLELVEAGKEIGELPRSLGEALTLLQENKVLREA